MTGRRTYLFVTWDGGGNLPPATRLGAELRRRGHGVRFLGHAGQATSVIEAGLDFRTFPTARPFSSLETFSPLAMVAMVADRGMARDVLADLEAQPADVVVVDYLLFAVMHALRGAGREYVVLVHLLESSLRKQARGPLGLILRARGLSPLELVRGGAEAIVTALPELEPGHTSFTHVGPIVTGEPATPTEPTVLVSLSTFRFGHLQASWQRVLDALDGLPARVVATIGPAVDGDGLRVPAAVELHRYLPHGDVLPHASLVVTHGGNGTTMAALVHDLPVLVLPTEAATDQPLVGKQIQRAGAGLSLSRRSSAATIRAATEQLLANGPHRAAAARLGGRIRELDGLHRGADLLESH